MNKKKIAAIVVIAIVIIGAILLALNFNKGSKSSEAVNDNPIEPVCSFIKIQYFDKLTYNDYKKLFTNEKKVMTKAQFDAFRKAYKPSNSLKFGEKTPEDAIKHLKEVKILDEKYKVYYLKNTDDIKDKKVLNKASYYVVVKKNNKWLIQN